MEEQKIARINELYHKSKAEGLTAEKSRNSRFCAGSISTHLREICAAS